MARKYKKAEIKKRLTAGEIIKNMRNLCELTQKQLAEKSGIRQSHISEMERGTRPVGKIIAEKLGQIFEVPPAFILFGGKELRRGSRFDIMEKLLTKRKEAKIQLQVIIKYTRNVKDQKLRKKIINAIENADKILEIEPSIEKE